MQIFSKTRNELTDIRIKKILLTQKYRQYFIPSLIAAMALSLSEFVDSIVVSNLLDSRALSIVNVCMPIMTLMAAVYMMLSMGGVVHYIEKRAKSDPTGASMIYTLCVSSAAAVGMLLLAIGLLFTRSIGNLLCPGLILGEEMLDYLHILMFSIPVLIVVSVVLYFLTAAGSPKLSMALNVFTNVLNLALDYVYIRIFNMGVSGAAAATLTSFVTAGILLLILRRRYDLHFTRIPLSMFRSLPRVCKSGISSTLSQVSFTIKFAFCNALAINLGGSAGLATMSLFAQAVSIISIAIAGSSDTIRPYLTLLRTQHDYDGIGFILKKTLRIVGITSVIFVAILEACPWILTSMYNVTAPEMLETIIPALRLLLICFIFRSICILFMSYIAIIRITIYSTFISLFDGFVGIIAIGSLLCRLFGLNGLWLTYPVDAFLLFCSIIIINIILQKKHPDRFTGYLLIEKDAPDVKVLDLAIDDYEKSAVYISQKAKAFCKENGVPKKLSMKIGLIAEETAIYIKGHIQNRELLNMLLHKKGDNIWLYFRSIGDQYDLSSFTETDIPENYKMLKALIPDYKYNYTIGMNNLRIKFDLKEGN